MAKPPKPPPTAAITSDLDSRGSTVTAGASIVKEPAQNGFQASLVRVSKDR